MVVLLFGPAIDVSAPIVADALGVLIVVAVGSGALVLCSILVATRIGRRLHEVTLLLNVFALALVILAGAAAADGVAAEFRGANLPEHEAPAPTDGRTRRWSATSTTSFSIATGQRSA